MPILVELQFEDGTSEMHHFPVQIWRKNNQTATRVFATDKPIKKIVVDPELKTADIDMNNNVWPAEAEKSKFDQFVSYVFSIINCLFLKNILKQQSTYSPQTLQENTSFTRAVFLVTSS